MPPSVTVTTGSRLHFGPFSYGNETGRRFGGLGVMLESPGCRVVASRSEADDVVVAETIHERVQKLVGRFREETSSVGSLKPGGVRITVPQAIPQHRGFGSGTQLALAVGEALHVLEHGDPAPVERIAAMLGRGRRSAIGIHGFARGGFLVDGGKSEADEIGRLDRRLKFPQDWAFVLITPPSNGGLRGEKETAAFRELPPMPASTSERLRSLADDVIAPSVDAADFKNFAPALFEFGATVGDFFAPVQGGRFAHPAAERLVDELQRLGWQAVAQSSWGPTLVVVVDDGVEAESIAGFVQSHHRWSDCIVRITSARNRPAEIVVTP